MSGYSFQHACYNNLLFQEPKSIKREYLCTNCGEKMINPEIDQRICLSLLQEGEYFHRYCLQWDTEWRKRNSNNK